MNTARTGLRAVMPRDLLPVQRQLAAFDCCITMLKRFRVCVRAGRRKEKDLLRSEPNNEQPYLFTGFVGGGCVSCCLKGADGKQNGTCLFPLFVLHANRGEKRRRGLCSNRTNVLREFRFLFVQL
ncbi:uncharacterized protein LOC143218488 [Lasioglossum baleicum]|uniref:uncharacterized protein LOC143218488 n=1 Tax=Lasioglossum baleicum TaxID=434251 RepID=UPI003FCECE26